ncbi:MAG TPA: F0F1 ATP synthase subunit B [Phycisphaerae bacterium]|nr:F0F1 ATP synthase subunit B [Phycisphaerae bacterium]
MKSKTNHYRRFLFLQRRGPAFVLAIPMAFVPLVCSSVARAADASGNASGNSSASGLLSPDPGMALITFLIFVILLVILGRLVWPSLMTGLKRREDSIRESIEAAAEAQAEVEKTRKMLEEKIAEVQLQAAAQLQQAKADAFKIAEKIQEKAEDESRALKEQAMRDIAAARQQALTQIADLAANVSVQIAKRILEREINVEDQRRLVAESIEELTIAEQS